MITVIKLSFLFIFVVIWFSCNTKKNDAISEVNGTINVTTPVENISVVPIPNQSEIYFDNAIRFFNEGKYSEASKEIIKSSDYLEKEARKTSKEIIKNNRRIKKYLNSLASEVKKKKIKSIDELKTAFEKVEFKVAHNFFLETEILILKNNYDSAIITMEKGDNYLVASSKYGRNNFKNLREKGKLFNSKLKKQTETISKELKEEFNQFILELKRIDEEMEGPVPI